MRSKAEVSSSLTDDTDKLASIAQQFIHQGTVQDIRPLGNGNINDTYLVNTTQPFVLQRINTDVFPKPRLVMDNLCQFVSHARQRLNKAPLNHRWEIPTVLRTDDNQHHWIDPQENVWRGLSFVHSTTTFDTIQDHDHAREIGYGLGCFHSLLSDLPP
ncbi:MAG: phosphotransferase, partial [Leptolyngbya sp. SIO3F4]|nr:phosphotransferase [Leptolyngbya sp. SIO3F4]